MQQQVFTIRTMECDLCRRYDSIMLTKDEIVARSSVTDIGVGAYSVVHNDHTRIIYFDASGMYLGDTIAMTQSEIPETLQTQPLPYFIRNKDKMGIFKKLRSMVFSSLYSKNLTISITGPSRAGKTSLVRYLETLVCERDAQLVDSVPTMGKSTKHIKLGNTTIKTLDMGGQLDFWDLWEPPIQDSNAIIFVLDGTSNNILEVARAFQRVVNYRVNDTPVLVILNKKDISLRGQASRFMSSGEFLALSELKMPIPNVKAIEGSVFEGVAYTEFEEVNLVEIIASFIKQHC